MSHQDQKKHEGNESQDERRHEGDLKHGKDKPEQEKSPFNPNEDKKKK